jgi:outer membrane receptor protein involved in Fe transport
MLIMALHRIAVAQDAPGTIAGRIIDANSGEPIIGVNVVITEQKKVTSSDINGKYSLTGVPAGKHTVVFQMMGYGRTKAEVAVEPGVVNTVNVSLSYQTTDEVLVTAKRISNTEASLLAARKKAAVAQDAISAEQIGKTPDSNAADAAKRVVGITMDKDNRVIIRGLAERYSSTMLGDTIVPSPDPDSRIVPIDIFPVSLLDNLIVIKAYTPDMPGEFCGGVVKIAPKDYPDELTARVSLGVSFHLDTVGQKFWTYKGGKTDWLGVDDGTRDMPKELDRYGLDKLSVNSALVPESLRYKIGFSMQNVYTPEKTLGFPSGKLEFSVGDTFTIKEKYKLGFLVSGLFSEDCKTIKSLYFRPLPSYVGFPRQYLNIEKSTYTVNKGGLLSMGFSVDEHKIRATTFYNQKSNKRASVSTGYNFNKVISASGLDFSKYYDLYFDTEDLLFAQLTGENGISPINTTIEWNGSYSRAARNEPDVRNTLLIDAADAGTPGIYRLDELTDSRRYWLKHTDWIAEGSGALVYKFKQWTGIYSKIKTGGGLHYRERDSSKRKFTWDGNGPSLIRFDPLEIFFNPYFITGSTSPTDPYQIYISEVPNPGDKYKGTLKVNHGFGMLDFPIIKELRVVGGYRYENSSMNIRTFDSTYLMERDLYAKPLKTNNHLGGVSITASPIDDVNIRLAYGKTLTRPDFREVSPFQYEMLTKNVYIQGNKYLKQTDIHNYDFRTEWFPSANEIVAVSVFYKYLIKPIELLETNAQGSLDLYTYRNMKSATNIGFEIELKKDLAFGGSAKVKRILRQFIISANLSMIWSEIALTYRKYFTSNDIDPLTFFSSIQDMVDLTILTSRNRPLQGQSPWVVNCGFEYNNDKIGFNGSVLFNMFGRRIVRVGSFRSGVFYGDVYEEPYPRLDVVLKQDILSYGQIKLTFSNLIDPKIKVTQELFNTGNMTKRKDTIESYRAGRSIGVSYNYKF